jgi:hypothetical protein
MTASVRTRRESRNVHPDTGRLRAGGEDVGPIEEEAG